MKKKFIMTLLEDPTGEKRHAGALAHPNEAKYRILLFWFALVPVELIGTPEEIAATKEHRLMAVIERRLLRVWDLLDESAARDLTKVAFWIGKREIEKRMERADLKEDETVYIDIENYPRQCPCQAVGIQPPVPGTRFELEVEKRIDF